MGAATTAAAAYDFGIYSYKGGLTDSPSGNKYALILNIPYRKFYGNSTPDYSFSIASSTSADNRLFYRTSGPTTWGSWQQIAHAPPTGSAVGSSTKPVFMAANGTITEATAYAEATVKAAKLLSLQGRSTTDTINAMYGDSSLRYYLITNTTSSSTPISEGHLLHFTWDWGAGSDTQLILPVYTNQSLYYRTGTQTPDTTNHTQGWGNWKTIVDSGNYMFYSNRIANSDDTPASTTLYFFPSKSNDRLMCIRCNIALNESNNLRYSAVRPWLYIYSINTQADTYEPLEYYERYALPVVTPNRTSNASFRIQTTRDCTYGSTTPSASGTNNGAPIENGHLWYDPV